MMFSGLLIAALLDLSAGAAAPAASPLQKLAKDVLARVETLRGQKLSKPLRSGVKARPEVTKFIQERLRDEYGPEKVAAEGELLRLMGLVPPGTDYGDLVTRLLTEQVAGFYDHTRQELHIADWIEPALQEPVMAHEIFHAIQDQEWGGGKLIDSKTYSQDQVLAHAALLEGDATYVMLAYTQAKMTGQATLEVDPFTLTFTAAALPVSMMSNEFPVMASAPDYLKQSLVFPYQFGLTFLASLRNQGWKSADFRKLYANPPASTEQILHPEKYTSQPDAPSVVTVQLPKGVRRTWEGCAGEFHYRLMLLQRLPPGVAEAAAAGWDGDYTALEVHTVAGKALSVVTAVTVWDSAEDATAFEDAVKRAHAARRSDPAVRVELATLRSGTTVSLTLSEDAAFGARILAGLPARTQVTPRL
jgi:hypothetical protein